MNHGYQVTHLGKNVWLFHLRATAFGIQYSDLLQANQTASSRQSWSEFLGQIAEQYAHLARRASAEQRRPSARQWWGHAVDYYHFGHIFLDGAQRRHYQTQRWQAYQCLASLLEPPCQRVAIPYRDTTLPGYLRVAYPGAPCVIMVGNFDFAKEVEMHKFGEVFLERGMSIVLFDGPGQGELADTLPMTADFEAVVSAVIDFLESERGVVDTSRLGIFGTSQGGYLAIRAATMDDRIRACLSLCGVFDLSTVVNMAPRAQQTIAQMFGFDTIEPFLATDGPFSLASLPRALDRPLFLIHASEDHLVPAEHIERLQVWSKGETRLWVLESTEHVCFSRFGEVLPVMGDWMAKQLVCHEGRRATLS